MITVVAVPFTDARAQSLWNEQQLEMARRYDDAEAPVDLSPHSVFVSLLGLDAHGDPVGTVAARWSPAHGPGIAEIKHLYVVPEHRRSGYARVLMGALERAAERMGAIQLVLETGTAQPEAISLYQRIGYDRITPYGQWVGHPQVVCMGKHLPTRVLVINGAMGAGKTATGYAALGLLGGAGVRVGFIDADALCEASPREDDDPYHQRLLFASLTALAPIYRERGLGCMMIARVVEDPEDRDHYARAFAGPGGHASVSIVQVQAAAAVREERLVAREPAGDWTVFALARTAEIADALEELELDDAVVSTDGVTREEAARDVLDAAGWWVPDAEPLV